LAKSGRKVALVDQYGPANARASSAGESRVTRLGFGSDAIYSEMAARSLPYWQALSDRCALPIFHRTGVLWFSPGENDYMRQSLAWLKANERGYWYGDADLLRARYPQMRFEDGEAGFLEKETGALIAGRAVQTLVAESGTPVVTAQAGEPHKRSDGGYQVTKEVAANALVYACGPWLAKVFPDLLGERIIPTRQEILHFGSAQGDARFAPPGLPVWADFNDGEIVYGLPDLESQGFKIAFDKHGPRVDPDSQDRRVSAETVERARAYLARRFPGLADGPIVHGRVCQYENSSNGDFLIDRLPGHENVWLVGGGSGHGFKHGPAVGERVARHIADTASSIEPRFSIATKGTSAARSVY
jgi:glycine/D-amino acid oxidase-like deaminating enzyme